MGDLRRARRLGRALGALAVALAVAGCGSAPGRSPAAPSADRSTPPSTTTTTSATTWTTSAAPSTSTTTTAGPGGSETVIALRVESDADGVSDEEAARVVLGALDDPRGWRQAGFRFELDPAAPYAVVVAEPADVDARCAPYDTASTYSCQIGPLVALNADRWREGVAHWPGSLDEYRTMLVNHEVGHLLGQHHASPGCGAPGEPAAVMSPQTKDLGGCRANPWPLAWELRCAAARTEPLAPPYEASPVPSCGPSS